MDKKVVLKRVFDNMLKNLTKDMKDKVVKISVMDKKEAEDELPSFFKKLKKG